MRTSSAARYTADVEMTLRKPGPLLAPFVEVLWHARAPAREIARERILPTGRAELIVDLADESTRVYDGETGTLARSFPPTILCGPHSRPFAIDTDLPTDVVGVHFRAGGARPFFAPPIEKLTDDHLALEQLWPRARAEELRSRLGEAASPAVALELLETWLAGQAVRPLAHHPAVAALLCALRRDPTLPRIGAIARHAGISETRLRELFHRDVGLGPKRFARIRRFQRVLLEIEANSTVDWADVAVGGGYFDQAHLIRDFRAFAGLTPSEYLAGRTEQRNHVGM